MGIGFASCEGLPKPSKSVIGYLGNIIEQKKPDCPKEGVPAFFATNGKIQSKGGEEEEKIFFGFVSVVLAAMSGRGFVVSVPHEAPVIRRGR